MIATLFIFVCQLELILILQSNFKMVKNRASSHLVRLIFYYYCFSITFQVAVIHAKVTSMPQSDSLKSLEDSLKINRTTDADDYFYTSYQRTIECTASFPPVQPKTILELQQIVHFALEHNYKVKAVGSLHSITDCICTDGIVADMKLIKHFSFDSQTNQATVGAGMELTDFLENLHDRGRGLTCSPIYGGITVGGAVGVGVHGTNLKQPAALSDQIVSLAFIDGLGNIRRIGEGDEDFKAFRVHLGLLGIVYDLTFRTTQQYKLEVNNFPANDEILWEDEEIMRIAKTNDFFQFFWYPTNKEVIMSVGNRALVSTPGNCKSHLVSEAPFISSNGVSTTLELMQATADQVGYFFAQSYSKLGLFTEVPGRTPVFAEVDGYSSCLPVAIGFSHRIMTCDCEECPWKQGELALIIEDSAVTIDLEELPRAINTLREIFDEFLVGFPLVGVLFRFMKESDSYLGLSSGRKSVEIEWVNVPRYDRTQPKMGIPAFQAIGQALVERHGGRSHWGKGGLYYSSPNIIRRAFPNLPKFVDVMRRMDPHEVFINNLGRRIKHGSNEMTMSRAAKERCALNEACLCQRNSDCGDGGPLAHVCGEFMEFKVCKKRPNPLEELRDLVARNAISLAADLANNVNYVLGLLAPYHGFGDVSK